MYGNIGSLPVGYNHKRLQELNLESPEIKKLLIHRPALGVNPPIEWKKHVELLYKKLFPEWFGFYVCSMWMWFGGK